MNLFYTDREISGEKSAELVLEGQEAVHASRVMRIGKGGLISVTDGRGSIFEGTVTRLSKDRLSIEVSGHTRYPMPSPRLVLAVGLIKKRDRLEFAVEKAAEMGVTEFIVFRGDNSEKQGVRLDRLEAAALQAMKQSLRPWLPNVRESGNLSGLLSEYSSVKTVVADETISTKRHELDVWKKEEKLLFIVGPEGGFSAAEKQVMSQKKVESF
ncbi:MAG: RsmE family RNA methyltransferase, partial [Balneolaceae bacterium]